MTLINNTLNNPYYTASGKLTSPTPTTSTQVATEKETKPSEPTGDRVTLSKGVAEARTREAMGLNPTGRLKLNDFKTAAENQEKIVDSAITSLIKELGVDGNQKISFSLNEKGDITINEKFPQKTKMEKILNESKEFSLTFNRLSANNEILDFTKSFQSNKTSLVEVMNSESDSDWSNLSSLASEYSKIKSSDNSLSTLLGISRKEVPYTFTHDPGKKVD
jgi:hypothetical protein